jgi:hypothetical protein
MNRHNVNVPLGYETAEHPRGFLVNLHSFCEQFSGDIVPLQPIFNRVMQWNPSDYCYADDRHLLRLPNDRSHDFPL